jgi:hypothetical protein
MPTDAPGIGLIHMVIESSNKSELFEWAAAPKLTKDGSIVFYRRDAQSSMKTLNFKDGFCIQFKEDFDANGSIPMRIRLTLAVRQIDCQGVMLEESWPGFENKQGGNGGSSGSSSGGNSPAQSNDNTIPSFIP